MDLRDYLGFLADTPRVDAFRRAIESSVRPGEVVLDLGTGLGTYALFAARCGARVLAVEADAVIDAARQLARANGLAERIVFLRGRLENVEPPERADVLVFEDFAPHLFEAETARILADVEGRWLNDGARSIPSSVALEAAPVTSADLYEALVGWRDDQPFGLDVRAVSQLMVNRLHDACWGKEALLAEPVQLVRTAPLGGGSPVLDAVVRWQASRSGTLHGLGMWIELRLSDGVEISNRPSGHSSGWNQRFLPLEEPVAISAGEEIEARVRTLGVDGGGPLWWTWRVMAGGRDQSMDTFRGLPLTIERLRWARRDRQPRLTRAGRVRRAVLELMDGTHSVVEIIRELETRFPGLPGGAAERIVYGELQRDGHRFAHEEGSDG